MKRMEAQLDGFCPNLLLNLFMMFIVFALIGTSVVMRMLYPV